MIPSDWADFDAQARYLNIANGEFDTWLDRYSGLLPSAPFSALIDIAKQSNATDVLWEPQYIDADYRDEFANFYASTFPPHPDRCERLHFFDFDGESDSYLGYSAVRPIVRRPVSRTVIAPPPDLRHATACIATDSTFPLGLKFDAIGFPFLGQDLQYGRCAHAAIWMISYYHHLAFRHGRRFISDIVRAAGAVHTEHRLIPSQGLTVPQVAHVFQELNLPAVFYDLNALPIGESAETIACRYLNSRLPVLLATHDRDEGGHATVLIGYQVGENGNLEFIRQNDAYAPYEVISRSTDPCGDWVALLVPMPGKIYMSGETAEAVGAAFVKSLARDPALKALGDLIQAGGVDFKSYAVQAREYKMGLQDRDVPADVIPHINRTSTSQWVWVVEAQDRAAAQNGRKCVIAEIVLDATGDGIERKPLFAILPGVWIKWPELTGVPVAKQTSQADADRMRSGTAIHI